jgi:hypothetical protein
MTQNKALSIPDTDLQLGQIKGAETASAETAGNH